MTTRPEIAEQLLRVVARQLREGHDMLDGLVFASVPGRVVTTLLRLAQRFGTWEDGHLRVTLSLRQKELAQHVGARWKAVNKVLTDFWRHGWIRWGGERTLLPGAERLERRAANQ